MTSVGGASKPVFVYTAYSAFVGTAIGVALLALALSWAAFLGGLSSASAEKEIALVMVFDLVLLAVSLVGLQRRVWSARFYDGSFHVRGMKLEQDFAYSQVEKLHRYRVFTGFRARDILIIDVSGGRSFTISANPKSATFGADLYRWLEARVPSQSVGPARA